MVELFANSEDPDQTPRSVASNLGLHCFPAIRLGVSSLQWVNIVQEEWNKKVILLEAFVMCTDIV